MTDDGKIYRGNVDGTAGESLRRARRVDSAAEQASGLSITAHVDVAERPGLPG